MIAPQRLYRTADGEVCDESDPRVAFVLVNVGHEVPKEYVAKVKAYLGEQPDEPEAEPDEAAADDEPVEPDEKKAAKPADKKVTKRANK